MTFPKNPSFVVVHELDRRVRLRSKLLKKKGFDPDCFEAGIEAIPGVDKVRVNTWAGSVVVCYDGRRETRNALISGIFDLPREFFNGNGKRKGLQSVFSVVGKGVVALSVLVLPSFIGAPLAFAYSAPVVLEGLVNLWKRGINVAVLDGSAVLFSLARAEYFTAASIVFLLSVGEYLETLSENRTTGLLKSLLKPQVEKIWVELDGQEMELPVEQAQIGDHVICGAGELIPLDGTVISGEASINTSSITGESVPVHVEIGSEVLSGSIVEEGRIVFEASRVGTDTSMARISTFLENSLRYESESKKKSDEMADRLVPVTFALGLGLLVTTRDLTKAAAVLTVDYSCAIKLANPVAIRVAMFTAARQGVLLKGSQAMDSLARIDTLVFDKTGTLTKGQLLVTDLVGLEPFGDEELLVLAASAEEHYSHPVASAVVSAAKERGLALSSTSQVDFIVAHGVSAYIDGENVLVGSRHFIEDDEQIDCSAVDDQVKSLQQEGKSILYVACSGRLVGVIGLRDELRPEADRVLRELKQTGVRRIVVLTGDAELTARALAAQLTVVDEVHWELKPEEKARIVGELQQKGSRVGFIGDGVNDAPALVSADVGICLPEGADLAKESAQVILMKEDLQLLLAGRLIAQRSEQTIQHSFIAAVGLNSAFLFLASFGLIMPVTAALLHNASTVAILGYAGLRGRKLLGNKKPDSEDAADVPANRKRN
ncbi:MAG: heavy metal translocating P-type ATPase [Proteobacteria bacterium]|nr:MAG: heavy metal translocating P-type ATPase [Pseudomonadota bacterium]PIE65368.1 MAG: heavy metal translocating P-type ATPase [Desulfobacterales bacterium]